MKTKFVLHGGNAHVPCEKNDEFFREILKNTNDELKVLLVLFSKEPDRVSKNAKEDMDQFNRCKNGKHLIFEIAEENKFETQIKSSDIIYFRGGSTERMINKLSQYHNLKGWLADKIVGAESAGVNALSKCCFSFKLGKVFNGLGVIPFKVICHFDESKRDKLNGFFDGLRQLNLEEYKYTVLTQEL